MKPIRINKKLIPLFCLVLLAGIVGISYLLVGKFSGDTGAQLVQVGTAREQVSEEATEPASEFVEPQPVELSQEETKTIAVFVTGAVSKPGVYYMEEGMRINDALARAGGALAHAHIPSVNLAAPIHDAMHIYIPSKQEIQASSFDPLELVASYKGLAQNEQEGSALGGESKAPTQTKINVNKAGVAELEQLPGVGPATAQKILQEREANGSFSSADDLLRVSGIGEKKLEGMRDSLSF